MAKQKSKKINVDKAVSYSGLILVLELILAIVLFFSYGLEFFTKQNLEKILMLTVGLLTFVSVFFTFVYDRAIRWHVELDKTIDAKLKESDAKIKKSNLNSDILRDTANEKDNLDVFRKRLKNSEFYLYFSVICYLVTLAMLIVMDAGLYVVLVKWATAIPFFIGFVSTLHIVTSLLFLSFFKPEK